MPIETHVIRGPEINTENKEEDRSLEKVANEISKFYNKVSERGGKVLGSAVMHHEWADSDYLL